MVLFESWEAVVTFRVSGRGRMGADGLVRRCCGVELVVNLALMLASCSAG